MKNIIAIILMVSTVFASSKTIAVSYFDNTSKLEEYMPLSKRTLRYAHNRSLKYRIS